jgi:hypothetical protein
MIRDAIVRDVNLDSEPTPVEPEIKGYDVVEPELKGYEIVEPELKGYEIVEQDSLFRRGAREVPGVIGDAARAVAGAAKGIDTGVQRGLERVGEIAGEKIGEAIYGKPEPITEEEIEAKRAEIEAKEVERLRAGIEAKLAEIEGEPAELEGKADKRPFVGTSVTAGMEPGLVETNIPQAGEAESQEAMELRAWRQELRQRARHPRDLEEFHKLVGPEPEQPERIGPYTGPGGAFAPIPTAQDSRAVFDWIAEESQPEFPWMGYTEGLGNVLLSSYVRPGRGLMQLAARLLGQYKIDHDVPRDKSEIRPSTWRERASQPWRRMRIALADMSAQFRKMEEYLDKETEIERKAQQHIANDLRDTYQAFGAPAAFATQIGYSAYNTAMRVLLMRALTGATPFAVPREAAAGGAAAGGAKAFFRAWMKSLAVEAEQTGRVMIWVAASEPGSTEHRLQAAKAAGLQRGTTMLSTGVPYDFLAFTADLILNEAAAMATEPIYRDLLERAKRRAKIDGYDWKRMSYADQLRTLAEVITWSDAATLSWDTFLNVLFASNTRSATTKEFESWLGEYGKAIDSCAAELRARGMNIDSTTLTMSGMSDLVMDSEKLDTVIGYQKALPKVGEGAAREPNLMPVRLKPDPMKVRAAAEELMRHARELEQRALDESRAAAERAKAEQLKSVPMSRESQLAQIRAWEEHRAQRDLAPSAEETVRPIPTPEETVAPSRMEAGPTEARGITEEIKPPVEAERILEPERAAAPETIERPIEEAMREEGRPKQGGAGPVGEKGPPPGQEFPADKLLKRVVGSDKTVVIENGVARSSREKYFPYANAIVVLKTDLPDGVYKIVGGKYVKTDESPDDYPGAGVAGEGLKNIRAQVQVPKSTEFMQALKTVAAAATTDQSRPVLATCMLQAENGKLRIVSTDGRRMHVATVDADVSGLRKGESYLIPAELVKMAIADNSPQSVSVKFSENGVELDTGNARFVARAVDGTYPNYKQVMPELPGKIYVVDTNDVRAAMREFIKLTNASGDKNAKRSGAVVDMSFGKNGNLVLQNYTNNPAFNKRIVIPTKTLPGGDDPDMRSYAVAKGMRGVGSGQPGIFFTMSAKYLDELMQHTGRTGEPVALTFTGHIDVMDPKSAPDTVVSYSIAGGESKAAGGGGGSAAKPSGGLSEAEIRTEGRLEDRGYVPGERAIPMGKASEPVAVADDRNYTIFRVEMPELVGLARELMHGRFPKIVKSVSSRLRGTPGRVEYVEGEPESITMLLQRDIFKLVPDYERERLLSQAEREAADTMKAEGFDPKENRQEYERRALDLYRVAFERAQAEAMKEHPKLGSKVLGHELYHIVDLLPDAYIKRGNIFGHIAHLKRYDMQQFHKEWIDQYIRGPFETLTDSDKQRIRREVEAGLRAAKSVIREVEREIPIFRVVKVTPDDIINIWVDNDARDKYPELYAFMASLNAAGKKEVLKAALRRAVAPGVPIEFRRQTGTKTVTERVIEQESAQLDPTVLRERVQQAIREEMRARGIVTLAEVRGELEGLIKWWLDTDEMPAHYRSPAEMFAEAGSILLNNPAAMQKRAPIFFDLVNRWRAENPEWSDAYGRVMNDIESGRLQEQRAKSLREDVLASTNTADEMRRLSRRWSGRKLHDQFVYCFDRAFGPVEWRAKKLANPDSAIKIKECVDRYLYRNTLDERVIARIRQEVVSKLVERNMDATHLWEYMFHKHVIENRFDIASPYGYDAKASSEALEHLRREIGDDNFEALREAQDAYWRVRKEEVIDLIRDCEIFEDDTMDVLYTRKGYVTIQPVRMRMEDLENMDPLDLLIETRYGGQVGTMIRRQRGYLGSIKNPFLATMEKDLRLMHFAIRERLKREMVTEFLDSQFAGEFKRAEPRYSKDYHRRQIVEIVTPEVGTITYLHRGELHGYYAPRALSAEFEGPIDAIQLDLAIKMSRALTVPFEQLFAQLNYGFHRVNKFRDVGAFRSLLPGTTMFGPRSYWAFKREAERAARSSLKGNPNDLALKMLKRQVWISYPRPGAEFGAKDPLDKLLMRYHWEPIEWGDRDRSAAKTVAYRVRRAMYHYSLMGSVSERAVKAAGMMYLDKYYPDMPEGRKLQLVHEMSGSPDFMAKGRLNWAMDFFWPFYNPAKEGIKSATKTMIERPAEFWWKSLKYVILPAVATEALRRRKLDDILGEEIGGELSAMISMISQYDWDNYHCIPLGWADASKTAVVYLRIPMAEHERLIHGITARLLRADEQGINLGTLANVAGGQLPGLNPVLGVGIAWSAYMMTGRTPYDPFRGTPIMSETVADAGGTAAYGRLAAHTWNTLGGGIITRLDVKQDPRDKDTVIGKILKLPVVSNSAGRFVRVSNRGVADSYRGVLRAQEQADARARLGVDEVLGDELAGRLPVGAGLEKAMESGPIGLKHYLEVAPQWMMEREMTPFMRMFMDASPTERMAILEEQARRAKQKRP